MNNAFRAEFGYDLPINDGYRDYAGQVEAKAIYGDEAAEPGTSNHGWALAIDVGDRSHYRLRFSHPIYLWLKANAPATAGCTPIGPNPADQVPTKPGTGNSGALRRPSPHERHRSDHRSPYPVYRLEVDAEGAVTLDGVPIATGEGATDAAIDHVAGILQADGHDAVRVIAATPDGTDRMVVEADGTTHVIVDQVHDGKMAIGNRRVSRRAVIASIVTVAGLVVIGAATPVAIALTRPAPTPTATIAPPPGVGEQLAVLSPPGYDQTAAWAVPIRSNTEPTFLPDGRVAVTTEAGDLRLLDPDTGKTVWKGNGSPRGGAQLAATTIGGYEVLATSRSNALTVWPLYVEDSTVDSVDYDLPAVPT